MLEVIEICKSYNKSQVLHGISLKLNPGEIHGLIGENSAGKTTLIKCITGIYKPDDGSVLVDGAQIYDNPAAKSVVGYVADYNEYLHNYSGRNMVKTFQTFYPEFDTEKFNHLNDMFDIPLEKAIRTLSKGQKMRLAIMLEISRKPKYLIMDEPSSGLDPMAKDALYKLLIQEAEENGVGILISSHNLMGLEKLCDSVTMIHKGKVEQQLSLEEMKDVLTKVNVVFEEGANPALYHQKNILHMSNIGSIYTLIVKDYNEETKSMLKECGASFVEQVNLSLEEVFVALEKSREK